MRAFVYPIRKYGQADASRLFRGCCTTDLRRLASQKSSLVCGALFLSVDVLLISTLRPHIGQQRE